MAARPPPLGSRNRSPPDSTPAGQGDKDRSADQSLKRRANLNAIVKGMYMSGSLADEL
jgi:hypothetical protein